MTVPIPSDPDQQCFYCKVGATHTEQQHEASLADEKKREGASAHTTSPTVTTKQADALSVVKKLHSEMSYSKPSDAAIAEHVFTKVENRLAGNDFAGGKQADNQCQMCLGSGVSVGMPGQPVLACLGCAGMGVITAASPDSEPSEMSENATEVVVERHEPSIDVANPTIDDILLRLSGYSEIISGGVVEEAKAEIQAHYRKTLEAEAEIVLFIGRNDGKQKGGMPLPKAVPMEAINRILGKETS